MTFSPIQIIFGLFILFAVARTVMKARSRSIPKAYALLWTAVWLALGVVALLPWTSDLLAASVGIGRGADLVVYLAIVALLYAVFKMVVKIQMLEQEMTKLVRKLAIKDLSQENHESRKGERG